jgi:hypothetical protein
MKYWYVGSKYMHFITANNRLKPYDGKWVKELPSVLWTLHTTLSHATGHTPFSLVYRSEAMLPTKVEHESFCVQHFNEEQSDDS